MLATSLKCSVRAPEWAPEGTAILRHRRWARCEGATAATTVTRCEPGAATLQPSACDDPSTAGDRHAAVHDQPPARYPPRRPVCRSLAAAGLRSHGPGRQRLAHAARRVAPA